jgi:DNA invertase Pin-like site-specific DNA recombinase
VSPVSAHAIYIRTSTRDQDGEGQLHALRKAARARRWIGAREFVDIGHSGAKARRPALDALLDAARRGEIRVVMVTALDRLGRSLRNLLDLLDELRAAGCAIVSLREGVDLTTLAGRAFMQVMAVLAEFERGLLSERVAAGLLAAKARGQKLGRPVVRPSRDAVAPLRKRGLSWALIAKELGCTSTSARRAMESKP